ncbi:hypothetical protein GCM10022237_08050 [Nocardioides ginsengisoli]
MVRPHRQGLKRRARSPQEIGPFGISGLTRHSCSDFAESRAFLPGATGEPGTSDEVHQVRTHMQYSALLSVSIASAESGSEASVTT